MIKTTAVKTACLSVSLQVRSSFKEATI